MRERTPAAVGGEELQAALEAYEAAASEIERPHKDMRGSFLKEVSKAFDSACEALVREHEALLATEQDNARVLNHRYAIQQLSLPMHSFESGPQSTKVPRSRTMAALPTIDVPVCDSSMKPGMQQSLRGTHLEA